MDLLKQFREVSLSVMPIAVLALVLSLLLGVMDFGEAMSFVLSCLLVIAGLTVFLTGVDIGIMPVGSRIGAALTRSRSLSVMLLASLLLGFIFTIPEPDVQVLATQVSQAGGGVPSTLLIAAIALGVGVFFAISIARTILSWPMKLVLAVSYIIIFILAFFCDDFFVSVAFDSGGATTGPLSVPFIMALGMGVANLRKHNDEAEFGYVALSSTGPVLAVLVLALVFGGDASVAAAGAQTAAPGLGQLFVSKLSEVGLSLLPMVAVVIVCQLFFLRLPRMEILRVVSGIVYAYVGIVVFFTGVEYSFSDVARELGGALMSLHPVCLCIAGFLFGVCVVLAEPAVLVLTEQVETASSGRISRKTMLATLALGVGLAVVLALVRTVMGFSIWYLLLPGYGLIFICMIWTPGLFSSIAFDSGGVATGPMSSTFLLPLAMGAAAGNEAMGSAASFGMIAMIAMMPILLTELLGIVYRFKTSKAEARND